MELLEKVLDDKNLFEAYKQVYKNKGTSGVDGVTVDELGYYMFKHKEEIKEQIRTRKYKPSPVRRVYIPKENGDKRGLGIPTVVDRLIQQAIVQVLTPIYEKQFSETSYGFRPNRSCEMAIIKLLEYFNSVSAFGYNLSKVWNIKSIFLFFIKYNYDLIVFMYREIMLLFNEFFYFFLSFFLKEVSRSGGGFF